MNRGSGCPPWCRSFVGAALTKGRGLSLHCASRRATHRRRPPRWLPMQSSASSEPSGAVVFSRQEASANAIRQGCFPARRACSPAVVQLTVAGRCSAQEPAARSGQTRPFRAREGARQARCSRRQECRSGSPGADGASRDRTPGKLVGLRVWRGPRADRGDTASQERDFGGVVGAIDRGPVGSCSVVRPAEAS